MGYYLDHSGDGEIRKWRLYYLGIPTPPVSVAATVSSGSQTVTPPSMAGIAIGVELSVADFDAPALGDTVSAALAGVGAGLVNVGPHSYMTVVNRTGGLHTGPSSASAPVTVASLSADGKVLATRTGGTLPTGYTWDLYRTPSGADPMNLANFKLVNPSPLSASTLTYLDNIADSALGASVPTASTGSLNAEVVTVTGTTGTTFTATFAFAHYPNWLLSVPAPVYWTDGDLDIIYGGRTWVAQPITPGPVSNQPDGASASFKIADANNTLFPVLVTINGGELALAAIYEAGFLTTNQTAVPDEVLEIFSGRVDRASVVSDTEDSIEFVLMPSAQMDAGELPSRLISTLVRDS